MIQPARQQYSYEEYLLLERESPIRHEFLNGEVWAMAGGSLDHSAIAVNVTTLLRTALGERRCRVFNTDLRIRVKETGLATYPDASVICGRAELDPDDSKGHTVVNPTLLVEVLSPSTENYDRGEKLAHYKRIPSLREVMLVAHDDRRVDLWRRTESGWMQLVFRDGDRIELTSLDCTLPLRDVYFDPLAEPDGD